jgi:hypothetical protein
MVMQVKGGRPLALGPGQMFYESPSDIHSVSANASKTKPAKFLALSIRTNPVPFRSRRIKRNSPRRQPAITLRHSLWPHQHRNAAR